MSIFRGWRWRLLISLILLGPLVPGLTPSRVAAQEDPRLLDPASIVLTTRDLEREGLDEYRVINGRSYNLFEITYVVETSQELDELEVGQGLMDAGYVDGYALTYHRSDDPDQPDDASAHRIVTRVYVFEDRRGAEDGYDIITNEDELRDAEDMEPVELGDEAELTELESDDGNVLFDLPHEQIELEILYDRLVLEVSAFASDSAPDNLADIETVVALGERLLERGEAALEGGSPSLLPTMLRLQIDNTVVPFIAYERLDSEPIARTADRGRDIGDHVARADGAGIRCVLVREQVLNEPNDEFPAIRFHNHAIQFEDEDAAAEYVLESADRFQESDAVSNLNVIDEATIGDSSAILEIEFSEDNGSAVLYVGVVQVGDAVYVQWVERDAPATALQAEEDVIIELAQAQVACIEDDSCTEAIPPPEVLQEVLEGKSGPVEDVD